MRKIDGTNVFAKGEYGDYYLMPNTHPLLFKSLIDNNQSTPATYSSAWVKVGWQSTNLLEREKFFKGE